MRCIKCGAENVEVARFCAECGAGLKEGLTEKKQAEKSNPRFDELISKNDKLFFLFSLIGGALFIIAGLVISINFAASDPLYFSVLRILTLLALVYVLFVAAIFILRMWPSIKGSHEHEKMSRAQLIFADNKLLRFGGAAFAGFLLLALIVTALLPRAQFNLRAVSVPEEIVYGDNIIFTAHTENFGRAAGNYDLTIFVDNVEVQRKSILLDAGSSKRVEIDLSGDYSPRIYQYSLGLGPLKKVDLDNTGQFRILTPAEFQITGLSLIPNQFDFNNVKDTKARVEIENVGEASGSLIVNLSIDGTDEESRDFFLEGGSKQYVDFPITIDSPGSYTIAVNEISELLEVYNIERPRNGTVLFNKISGGYGQLKVINKTDVDTVFIYARSSEPLSPLVAVYIHANNSATVRGLRDGIYIGYYSTGLDWDSHSKRFTRNADHGRYEEDFDYSTAHRETDIRYEIWTFTFGDLSPGEGATTINLSPERFPVMPD